MRPIAYHRILINPFPPRSNRMLAIIQRVQKALGAAASGAILAYAGVAPDGVTAAEWLKVLAGALGAGLVVWAVPANKPVAP